MTDRPNSPTGHQRARERPDASRRIVAGLVAGGGFVHVLLGGLSAPPVVVLLGVVGYAGAVVEMVRRLRAGDAYALAVPVVALVVWTAVLLVGMMVGVWVP